MRGKHSRADQDIISVSKRSKDIHAMLRYPGIHHASEKIRSFVDGMSGEEPTKTMSNDKSAFLLRRCTRSIAL